MTQYLFSLPPLIMTILCVMFLTSTNQNILPEHKKGFYIAYWGEIFIIIFEALTILLNGSAEELKPIHFFANYAGFLLSPILIGLFAVSVGRFRHFKEAMIGIGAYFILFNVLIAAKKLFFIDAQNIYHRGSLFFVYVVAYLLATIYLLYETIRYSKNGFIHHRIFAYLLSVFFLVSCCCQIFKPEVYTTRISATLCLCLYYTYNTSLTDLFDKLTGILNQSTYLKRIEELKVGQTVVILDIDDFKKINDNFGHQYGDNCLKSIAEAIKSAFGKHGQCYRIGGDEFAVILKNNAKIDSLIAQCERNVADKTQKFVCPVSVSIGYCKYEHSDSYETVVQRADSNMYNAKKQRKALNSIK
jgi:diguanylate cyclase (GGDEF)-like protein